jgi:hypothetical protein
MRRLAHRAVIHVQIVPDRPHHDLAGVEPHADLDLEPLRSPEILRVAPHGVLDAEGRVAGPHRVIFMRQRGAEEGHDPVAHHLVDCALVAVDRLHHPLEDRV